MSKPLTDVEKRWEESFVFHRYYCVPPGQKTLHACHGHGADHRAYDWSPQIDPRWNREQ